ncbi:MAG: hypothetical protein IJU10_01055 [Clostridia bacterium]|nr:hypothetical protein [Clostridia bacterium]
MNHPITFHFAVCIDGTKSMAPILDAVKANIEDLIRAPIEADYTFDYLCLEDARIKFFVFRDHSIQETDWVSLLEEPDCFDYVKNLVAEGKIEPGYDAMDTLIRATDAMFPIKLRDYAGLLLFTNSPYFTADVLHYDYGEFSTLDTWWEYWKKKSYNCGFVKIYAPLPTKTSDEDQSWAEWTNGPSPLYTPINEDSASDVIADSIDEWRSCFLDDDRDA